jgi:hypothetical protein
MTILRPLFGHDETDNPNCADERNFFKVSNGRCTLRQHCRVLEKRLDEMSE